MTTDRRLDETISRWLEGEAPTQLPDRVLRATFQRTRKTSQDGGWRALLGRLHVNRFVFALGGAAVVLVAAVLAVNLYGNNPSPGVGGPGATPTSRPAVPPTPGATATTRPAVSPTPGALGLPEGLFAFEGKEMAMTVTIPASGWAFDTEFTALEKGVELANLPEAAILFWSYPDVSGFTVYGDPCQWSSTTPDTPVTTVEAFAAALAAQASRNASGPIDVVIGGYAGKSVTLHVPDDLVGNVCDQGNFASYGVEGESEPSRWHQGPGQIDQLWILDVDGTVVVIDAMYRPDTPAELVEEMRGIVESTRFETP